MMATRPGIVSRMRRSSRSLVDGTAIEYTRRAAHERSRALTNARERSCVAPSCFHDLRLVCRLLDAVATARPGHRHSHPREREARMSQANTRIKNVVLVHGGFVDGSGWEGVYQLL